MMTHQQLESLMLTSDLRSGIAALSTKTLVELFTEIGAELVVRDNAGSFDVEMLQRDDEPDAAQRLAEWKDYGVDDTAADVLMGNYLAGIEDTVNVLQGAMVIEELNKRCLAARKEADEAST